MANVLKGDLQKAVINVWGSMSSGDDTCRCCRSCLGGKLLRVGKWAVNSRRYSFCWFKPSPPHEGRRDILLVCAFAVCYDFDRRINGKA